MSLGPKEWGPILVLLVIFGAVGAAVGSTKGHRAAGFWLGFLLGPIGVLVAVLLPPRGSAS